MDREPPRGTAHPHRSPGKGQDDDSALEPLSLPLRRCEKRSVIHGNRESDITRHLFVASVPATPLFIHPSLIERRQRRKARVFTLGSPAPCRTPRRESRRLRGRCRTNIVPSRGLVSQWRSILRIRAAAALSPARQVLLESVWHSRCENV